MIGQSGYKAPRSGGPMMKGMGQSGMMAQGSQAGMGIPQPKGSFTGPAGVGPKRMPQAPMGMATRPPVIANKARGTMSSATYSQIPSSISGMGQPPLTSISTDMGQPLKSFKAQPLNSSGVERNRFGRGMA
jgi:hypothetical protein